MATILRFALVLALVALLSACSTSNGGSCINPAAPCGDNGGGGDPDQTGLDPLGDAAPKHYLKDAAGKETPVWVRLLSVNPVRRSVVKGNSGCSFNCFTFSFSAEVGADAGLARMALVSFSLSGDCLNGDKRLNVDGNVPVEGGTSNIRGGEVYYDFSSSPIPKCLLVLGEQFNPDDANGRRQASTRIMYPLVLDYQAPG